MAGCAAPQSDVVYVVDVKGTFREAAFDAFVYDLFELAEHFTPYCHYSLNYIIYLILLINFPRWTCLRSRM